MFCAKCGEENPDDARFCGACGATCATQKSDPPPVTKVVKPPEDVKTGAVTDGLKYGILGGSLFFPIIGIVMGLIYFLSEGSEEKKSVGKLWLGAGIVLAIFYAMITGTGF